MQCSLVPAVPGIPSHWVTPPVVGGVGRWSPGRYPELFRWPFGIGNWAQFVPLLSLLWHVLKGRTLTSWTVLSVDGTKFCCPKVFPLIYLPTSASLIQGAHGKDTSSFQPVPLENRVLAVGLITWFGQLYLYFMLWVYTFFHLFLLFLFLVCSCPTRKASPPAVLTPWKQLSNSPWRFLWMIQALQDLGWAWKETSLEKLGLTLEFSSNPSSMEVLPIR